MANIFLPKFGKIFVNALVSLDNAYCYSSGEKNNNDNR